MTNHEACARCGAPGYIHAYWGHVICQPCAQLAAQYFDAHDNWPPLPAGDQLELDSLGDAGVNR